MSLNDNMADATRCIEISRNAIEAENYTKAKRLLLKAERIHPTDAAKDLLEQIERLTIKDEESRKENEDLNDLISAEKCITIARTAMAVNNYDKAERFLKKSLNFHKLDEAIELLEELKKERESKPVNPRGTLKDAELCIEKAQDAISQGNLKKALKLLLKAERMYPTEIAKNNIKNVREMIVSQGGDPDKIVKEKNLVVKKAAETPPPEPKKRETTDEQVREIQRVMQANDDYEILGVPKGSAKDKVKKAYKNLTKMLHPDKNRAPQAKDAFMIVYQYLAGDETTPLRDVKKLIAWSEENQGSVGSSQEKVKILYNRHFL